MRIEGTLLKRSRIIILVLFVLIAALLAYFNLNKFIGKKEKLNFASIESLLPCKDCNVIVISIDTLRAKSMSLYGYEKKTTPYLDELGKESLVFSNAVTVAPWTLPSHMSLFTGVYPSKHKVVNKYLVDKDGSEYIANLTKVAPDIKTLAEILKVNGYSTAGFTGGAGVHRQFGFDKGFDTYEDSKDFSGFSESIPKALEWIKSHKEEKFFIFLHGYDAHGQYIPDTGYDFRFVDFDYKGKINGSKEEQEALREDGLTRGKIFLTTDDVKFLTALYDEKVQRADEKIDKFMEEFKNMGLWDKTIIIVTSDHGEELYEHGRIDHGHSLYEEQIWIPLIIRLPGNKDEILVDSQVSNIDIMPTLFDMLAINSEKEVKVPLDGVSIVNLIKESGALHAVFPETDYRYVAYIRSVRTEDGWKLIKDLESEETQLYNFKKDPVEEKNLAKEMKEKVNELIQALSLHTNYK